MCHIWLKIVNEFAPYFSYFLSVLGKLRCRRSLLNASYSLNNFIECHIILENLVIKCHTIRENLVIDCHIIRENLVIECHTIRENLVSECHTIRENLVIECHTSFRGVPKALPMLFTFIHELGKIRYKRCSYYVAKRLWFLWESATL